MLKLTIHLFLMISWVRKRKVWGMVAYNLMPQIYPLIVTKVTGWPEERLRLEVYEAVGRCVRGPESLLEEHKRSLDPPLIQACS